ncbi:alanine racemase [Paenibacillaceae bacterium GAS479]|nr:alanine racemase [Paenibacillaceae bacterium GAS479]
MYRDTWAEIDFNHIRHNISTIRRLFSPSVKMMAVVKANGYGHGGTESAYAAEQAGADYLAVAYLDEALRLREAGLKLPILILTPIRPEQVTLALEFNLMLTITSASWFKEMRVYKPQDSFGKLNVHIKCDTGLGRIGLRTEEEWSELVPWLRAADIVVDGFFTHFATAGQEDNSFLYLQTNRFTNMMGWARNSGLTIGHYHCTGSAAALRFPYLAMDMVRIGAALYGFYPDKLVPHIRLKPALSLHSRILQTKKLKQGEYLGYDNSYFAEEDQWIGTVPIGYGDGWTQRMQGTEVLVNGQRAKVIGKISMDQLMIKLPQHYPQGTQVTLIGSQGNQTIACKELASHINSVPQEISSSLNDRIFRTNIGIKEVHTEWAIIKHKARVMS